MADNNTQNEPAHNDDQEATRSGENLGALRARVSALSTEKGAQKETAEADVVIPEPVEEKEPAEKKDPLATAASQDTAAKEAETELKDEVQEQEISTFKKEVDKKIEEAKNQAVKPLRTFKSDVADSMRKKNTSYIGIIAKEQRKRAEHIERVRESKTGKTIYLIGGIVSVALVVLGIGTLVYTFSHNTPQTVTLPKIIPSHIFVERSQEVDVTDINRSLFLARLSGRKDTVDGTLGSIEQLYPTLIEDTQDGSAKRLLTAREFFERTEARVPDSFLRTLETPLTLGVHVYDGNETLLIVNVKDFETALAGMLSWEQTMNEDLAPLFGPVVRIERSSTTPFGNIVFRDAVIRNKEVRELKDAGGSVILLYSFVDRSTLVLATNEQTFIEILSRLNATNI